MSWQLLEKASLRDAPPMLTRRSYATSELDPMNAVFILSEPAL